MNTKLIIPFLILALLAGGVMLGCNDDNSPTAALPDYRPPSVEWIAPSPDDDLSGETTLLIAASDDDEVANVAVYLNGQAPDDWRVAGHADTLYSFTWDTRDYSDAYYNLEARAWDASGNLGTSPALLVRVANDDVTEDIIPPDVWWTAPDPGNVRGEVELSFRVLDDNPLQRVRLYQNGIMPEGGDIAVNDEGVYSLHWNTLADSDGVYCWEARAWDEAGNLGTSPVLLVRVANDTTVQPEEDNIAPDVWWTAPDPGSVRGEVELTFRVLDDSPLQRVRIYQNGVMPEGGDIGVNDEGVYFLIWNTLADSDGVYSWEARAWDEAGNLGISPALLVRVANDTTSQPDEDNIAPDVWWTAPDPGNVRGEVELSFRVFDDNPLQRVKIYQNGVMPEGGDIAVNDEGVYSLNWNTLADSDGVYSWEARAWDASGNLGTSPALLVRVANDTTSQPDEDRTPPVIAWMSPQPGDTLQSLVNLRFQIIDESPIDTAIIMVNGQQWQKLINLDTFVNGDVIWSTSEFNDGIYLIQIKAMDSARNVAYSEVIRFTVWNNRPRLIWVPDDFETIQEAINFSSDGDTIRVRPGTYREGLRLMGKNIWLESEEGPEVTIIDSEGWNFAIMVYDGEKDAVVRGFTFINGYSGISIEVDAIVTAYNCIFTNFESIAFNINNSNSRLLNTIIYSCNNGVRSLMGCGVVYNCVFMQCSSGIRKFALYVAPLCYGWNLFWANENDYTGGFEPDANDIFADPQFVDGSFILGNDSPALDAGHPDIQDTDNSISDIGIYGGPYAYPIR